MTSTRTHLPPIRHKKTGEKPVFYIALTQEPPLRLLRESADLLGQPALMPRSLIAMNDALVDHAVDDRGGGSEGGGRLVVFAGLERRGGLAYGAAQLRGERVVTGSMHRRLSGSFFSRFRIRQAQTPYQAL
jgi:hypothetical protein